jgi:hypothetical protein
MSQVLPFHCTWIWQLNLMPSIPFHCFSWDWFFVSGIHTKCMNLCWNHIDCQVKGLQTFIVSGSPQAMKGQGQSMLLSRKSCCVITQGWNRLKHGANSSGLFTFLLLEMALCIPGVESDEVTVQDIEKRNAISYHHVL